MDPVSALSFAANVVQVVDFGMDCIQGCLALYEKGSRDGDESIGNSVAELIEANNAYTMCSSNSTFHWVSLSRHRHSRLCCASRP